MIRKVVEGANCRWLVVFCCAVFTGAMLQRDVCGQSKKIPDPFEYLAPQDAQPKTNSEPESPSEPEVRGEPESPTESEVRGEPEVGSEPELLETSKLLSTTDAEQGATEESEQERTADASLGDDATDDRMSSEGLTATNVQDEQAQPELSQVPETQDEKVQNEKAPDEKRGVAKVAEDPPGNRVGGPAIDAEDDVLAGRFQNALVIDIQGAIFGKFFWYLNNRLDLAKKEGVDLVVLRLTSPGGDLEYSLQLARRLRDIDWATTIVYIPEEAISGGAIISFGADRIYMQERALIGDAGPIRMGMGGQFEHAEEKVVSYLAEAISELAESNNRPGALAEAMVDRNLTVFELRNVGTQQVFYVTEKELEIAKQQAGIEVVGPVAETGQNRFLTVAANRAQELGLCEGVFANEADLAAALVTDKIDYTQMTWVDHTVYLLNRPWLTALLLIAGLIGLYLEMAAPGISVAGLSSLLCFGIFFWSHALGGTSGWLEVMLFLLGVVCVICELFVLPGFGVFGVSGLVLLVLSLVMASQDFLVPDNTEQWAQLRVNLVIVLGSILGVLIMLMVQVMLLDSLPGLNRLRLATPDELEPVHENHTQLTASMTGEELPAVGTRGVAESDLRPSGKVLIDHQLVDVITEGDYVNAGTPIAVVKVEGNRVIVRRVDG